MPTKPASPKPASPKPASPKPASPKPASPNKATKKKRLQQPLLTAGGIYFTSGAGKVEEGGPEAGLSQESDSTTPVDSFESADPLAEYRAATARARAATDSERSSVPVAPADAVTNSERSVPESDRNDLLKKIFKAMCAERPRYPSLPLILRWCRLFLIQIPWFDSWVRKGY